MKTKKVIRVLEISLLFKKQDYNHYYLDRHSLQYQYKKEENRRQLRVVIDLHKSHIDFFCSLVLFFGGFLLEPVLVFTIANQRSKYASDCYHQATKPTSAYLHILQC